MALVTGGNSGIGLGMADAMAQAGADVVIWGNQRREERRGAEGQLKGHGGRVMTQKIDVADEAAVAAGMVEADPEDGPRGHRDRRSRGVGGGAKSFAEFSTETYRRKLAVNLDGVFFTLREACKHMVERLGRG